MIPPELVCRELSFFVVWLHSNLQKPFRKESSREMQSLNGPGFVVIYHLTTMFSMINENKTLSIMIGQQYCHLSFNTTLSFIIWHQYCHLSFAINVVIYHLITLFHYLSFKNNSLFNIFFYLAISPQRTCIQKMGWCFSELELLISSFIEENPRLCTQCNILTAKGAQGKLSTEYLSSETDWCAIDQSGTGLGATVTICNNIRIWNKNDLLQYRSQDHLFLRVVIIGCRGLIYNVLLWCGGRWWNATTARASHNILLSRFLKFSDFFTF